MNKKEFEEIYNETGHGPGSHFDRLWSRLAPLMQDEYSLPKCLKCGVVINSVKQDGTCGHQYTDRRSGSERREEHRRSKFGRRSWDFPGICEVKSADRRKPPARRKC